MRRLIRQMIIGIALISLSGCVITPNKYPKPGDLSPSWLIDRLRVLAIRADPPEVRPGELVTFEALVVDPSGDDNLIIWLACPPEDEGGVGFGCEIDPNLDLENADFEELAESGLIGFEPLIPPVYVPEEDLLDDLTEEERQEGINVLVQVTAFPGGLEDLDPTSGDLDDIDFNAVEAAYKRLIVSEASTPNTNPTVAAITVEGVEMPLGSALRIDPFQEYRIGVVVPDSSLEEYEFVNRDGVVEQRVEEPYASWYSTGGTVLEPYTLHPFWEATWRSPKVCKGEDDDPDDCLVEGKTHQGSIYGVVRDRRGGMDWLEQRWEIEL